MSNVEVISQTQVVTVSPITQTLNVNTVTGTAVVVNPSTPSVTVVNAGPVGPRGFSGGGGSAGYDHIQNSALDLWTINHNLGYKPSVQTFTVGGLEVLGEIQHISNNQVVVTFNTTLSGTARLV
jgi:hypothetical protein